MHGKSSQERATLIILRKDVKLGNAQEILHNRKLTREPRDAQRIVCAAKLHNLIPKRRIQSSQIHFKTMPVGRNTLIRTAKLCFCKTL